MRKFFKKIRELNSSLVSNESKQIVDFFFKIWINVRVAIKKSQSFSARLTQSFIFGGLLFIFLGLTNLVNPNVIELLVGTLLLVAVIVMSWINHSWKESIKTIWFYSTTLFLISGIIGLLSRYILPVLINLMLGINIDEYYHPHYDQAVSMTTNISYFYIVIGMILLWLFLRHYKKGNRL